jgi:hypothetical protein
MCVNIGEGARNAKVNLGMTITFFNFECLINHIKFCFVFFLEFQMGVDHGNFNISSFHFVDWMGLFKCLDGLQTEHY